MPSQGRLHLRRTRSLMVMPPLLLYISLILVSPAISSATTSAVTSVATTTSTTTSSGALSHSPHHDSYSTSFQHHLHLPFASQSLLRPIYFVSLLILTLVMASVLRLFRVIPSPLRVSTDGTLLILFFAFALLLFAERLEQVHAAGYITFKTFTQYFLAGGLCAFMAHALCTPIDVVKTRIQTAAHLPDDPKAARKGMVSTFLRIVSEEGPSTLLKGLGATASGYFLHGAFKFSFYELFKVLLSAHPSHAVKPSAPVAALSGFFAECIACLLLCPMEAIRIRCVADASFPSGVITGLSLLLRSEGLNGWFKGLPAMLLKQVPYTVGQFVSFEVAVGLFLKLSLSSTYVSLCAGLCAGVTAAIISHPGDTILSKVNQEQSEGSPIAQINRIVKVVGPAGLFIGLGPRLIQVSLMIGGQFLIYDSIKLWCGIVTASAAPVAVSQMRAPPVAASVVSAVKKM